MHSFSQKVLTLILPVSTSPFLSVRYDALDNMKLLLKHGAQIHGSGALAAIASQGKVEVMNKISAGAGRRPK